jgi:ABC-2 type transport system permease protein
MVSAVRVQAPAGDLGSGAGHAGGRSAVLAPRARLLPSLAAVYRAQLSRARVARIPLLFVATFQSIGIMILMRGVVDGGSGARAVVAGSAVLVVAFVALNLLAQYFGRLRADGGLDHYATLPVPPAAVVLGAAAAYASFTAPGTLVTAVVGSALFQLPMAHLWVLVAVIPLSGAALAGLGAALGLLAPRQELATLCGQLGMSAALLLGVLPAERMPAPVSYARDVLPSTYGVEALARSFDGNPDWLVVCADLGVCAGVAVVSLTAATWAYRRAAVR